VPARKPEHEADTLGPEHVHHRATDVDRLHRPSLRGGRATTPRGRGPLSS
jgi:hypothetical protein